MAWLCEVACIGLVCRLACRDVDQTSEQASFEHAIVNSGKEIWGNSGKDIWGYDILKPIVKRGTVGKSEEEDVVGQQLSISNSQVVPGRGV